MIHTREDIERYAEEHFGPPGVSRQGWRVVEIHLDPADRSWNPKRNDTLLRGPAVITYVLWDGGDVDVRVKALA